MFAVVETGGKQYKVAENDKLVVERLPGEAGDSVTLDQVLLVNDDGKVSVGTPTVAGIVVTAQIVEQTRGDKIIVFKKKRRQNYRRKKGHRQHLTVLEILGIGKPGTATKKAAPVKEVVAKADKPAAAAEKSAVTEKASSKKAAAPKTSAAPAKKAAAPKKAASPVKKPAAKKPATKKPAAKPSDKE